MICKKCGTENKDGMKYCKYCGNDLLNQEENYASNNEVKKSSKLNKILITLIVITVIFIAVVVVLFFISTNNISETEDVSSSQNTTYGTVSTETESITDSTAQETTESVINVPDVIGMTISDACQKLNDERINYSISYSNSDTVEKDFVISQSPYANSKISSDEKVILYVSKGGNSNFSSPSSYVGDSNTSEYILNGSDSRYIGKSEISNMDKKTMELALNEIYARHGRKFSTKEISDYFNSKSWYHGTIEPNDFSESVINKYERANIDLIVEVMEGKGYR